MSATFIPATTAFGRSLIVAADAAAGRGVLGVDGIIAGAWVVKKDGTSTSFKPSADTDAARGTALLSAISAAASGSQVVLGPGDYDVVTTAVALPAGVDLKGSGRDVTRILSQMPSSGGVIVRPRDGAVISDLSIIGNAASPDFQLPVGVYDDGGSITQSSATNVTLRNLGIEAGSDGLFIEHSADTAMSWVMEDCVISTKFDCIAIQSDNVSLRAYGCDFTAAGDYPASSGNQTRVFQNSGTTGGSTLWNGCRFKTTHTTASSAYGAFCSGTSKSNQFVGCLFDVPTGGKDFQSNISGCVAIADCYRADGGALETASVINYLTATGKGRNGA